MLQSSKQHNRIAVLLGISGMLTIAGFGCSGGSSETPAPTTPSGATTVSSGGASPAPGPGVGLPGAGAPGVQQANATPAGTTVAGAGPPPGARSDPFRPWFSTTPPPPGVLTLISPMRIALPDSSPPVNPPGVDVQEVPSRRVAGILTGNGIYALFDDGQVVKPGDLVDDYRVTMITKSAVTLKKKVNNQTFTQIIPLTDAGSAPSRQMSSPGMGSPGLGPGSGRPGQIPGTRGSGSGGGAGQSN